MKATTLSETDLTFREDCVVVANYNDLEAVCCQMFTHGNSGLKIIFKFHKLSISCTVHVGASDVNINLSYSVLTEIIKTVA